MTFIQTLNDYKDLGLLVNQIHPTLPLIIWNYSTSCQYGQNWDSITLQCRALVTDTDGNIVSRGFSKFFNIEEDRHEATDDFEIFEKLDGQYIGCFWFNGEMVVNSKGSFTSPYAIEAKRILEEKYSRFANYMNESPVNSDYSYIFELIGFEQVVVSYSELDLILTGVFRHCQYEPLWNYWDDISVGFEGEQFINSIGLKIVQKFNGLDWKSIKQLNWQNSEGFVVRFSNGQRCKIKFEDYIELHRVMTNQTTGQIWRALANGEPVSSILEETPDEFYDKIHSYEKELKDKFSEIEELSKIYFDYFKPLLEFRRRLFVEKVNLLLVEPYCSVVKSMIDNKYYDEIIWNAIEPEQSVKI